MRDDSWLERYASPSLIRNRGSFRILSTTSLQDGAPRVVVVPNETANQALAKRALARFADGHDRLAGGIVPAVVERGPDWVVLASDGAADLETVVERIAETRFRSPYEQATTLVDSLLRTLTRATETSPPVCFGGLAPANLLVGPTGTLSLIGAGFNIAAYRDDGTPTAAPSFACAPEVAAGGPATPSGDLYAATVLFRSMIGFVDFPPAATRVLRGCPEPEDLALANLLMWSNLRIVASIPDLRPTAAEALANAREGWSLLGLVPDYAGHARSLGDLMATPTDATIAVDIDRDAAVLTAPDGTRHELGSRRSLWRILLALVDRQYSGSLDLAALLTAGWPGERLAGDSGASRVYVALSSLRKLGLDAAIDRHDGGWRFNPRVKVTVSGTASPEESQPRRPRGTRPPANR